MKPQTEPSRARTSGTATTQSEHAIRWDRTVIKVAFLEDIERKIYVMEIKELDPVKVLGISQYNQEYIFESVYMMKAQIQQKSLVNSKHKIVSIKEVYARKLC